MQKAVFHGVGTERERYSLFRPAALLLFQKWKRKNKQLLVRVMHCHELLLRLFSYILAYYTDVRLTMSDTSHSHCIVFTQCIEFRNSCVCSYYCYILKKIPYIPRLLQLLSLLVTEQSRVCCKTFFQTTNGHKNQLVMVLLRL